MRNDSMHSYPGFARVMKSAGVALAIGLTLLGSLALAQTSTGRIVGSVKDSTGAVIQGVEISIEQVGTGATFNTTSNEIGEFTAPQLQPGQYRVTAKHAGFKSQVQSSVTVSVNEDTNVAMAMELGSVAETIEVTGEAGQVQTHNSTMGQAVQSKQIVELPLNGRNFLQLALLQAGVSETHPAGWGGGTYAEGLGNFTVNGARVNENNFMIDGVAAGDLEGNMLAYRPNVDSIEEFKIQTNTFSAEFGRNPGAITNVVTKSGTNQLHGAAWEFLRNDKLNARNFFASERPTTRRNQYGFAVGGPIKKDRTFFFTSWEWYPIREFSVAATTVPTDAQKGGDFSALGTPIIDPTTKQPFQGNKIPTNELDAAALKLAAFWPSPNRAGAANNFSSSAGVSTDSTNIMARIDHKLTESDQLFGRILLNRSNGRSPYQGPSSLPDFYSAGKTPEIHFTLGESHVFSPTFLNEFKAGYVRQFNISNYYPIVSPTNYGINFSPPAGVGLPEIDISGQSGLGNSIQGPSRTAQNTYQLSDTLSLTRGKHTMKFGVQFLRIQENFIFDFIQNGYYQFTGTFTGNAFADFMLGRPDSFRLGVGRSALYIRASKVGEFFQDDYRISRKLTLNLGARYDYFQPLHDKGGETSTFAITKVPTPGVPQSGTGVVLPNGANGLGGTNGYFPDHKNIAPRVGFAYDVLGNGKLAIRGGSGIFFADMRDNLAIQQIFAFPWVTTFVIQAPSLDNPLAGQTLPGKPTFPQTSANSLVAFTDPHIRTPYYYQYNFNIQYESGAYLFQAAYVGGQGHRLMEFQEWNQPIYVPGASSIQNIDARRPYQGFESLLCSCGWGKSNYNSLQLSVQRRFTGGLQFMSAFTWGKSIDNSSQFHAGGQNTYEEVQVPNENNRAAERAVSSFDTKFRWVSHGIWDIPVGKGRKYLSNMNPVANGFLGGWEVVTVLTVRSGFPFTIRDPSDTSLTDGPFIHIGRPDLVHTEKIYGDPNHWYDQTAYARAAIGQFGNLSRNTLRTDSMRNTDLGILKNFNIFKERIRAQFRGEFFNLTNSAVFGLPGNDPFSPTPGAVGSTLIANRVAQVSLKLNF